MKKFSFSRLSLRALAFGCIGMTLMSALLLAVTFAFIHTRIGDAGAHAERLRRQANPLEPAIGSLVTAIGYGGMIHDFKNAVIRGGSEYPEEASRRVGAVLNALNDVVALDSANAADAEAIRQTIKAYEKNVTKVAFLRSVGTSPEEVAEVVAVDDAAAAAAIHSIMDRLGRATQGKSAHLQSLREELGYDGAIHAFKDFVIFKTPELAAKARTGFEAARDHVAAIEAAAKSAAELAAASDLEKTLEAYLDALSQVSAMAAQGATSEEIDAAVQVSDEAAIRALGVLDRAILLDVEHTAQTLDSQLERVRTIAAILGTVVLVGGLLISIAVGIALMSGAVRPAARISEGMRKLADGDTDVDFSEQVGRTEIGVIAGVATHFADTLRHNQKLRAESEAQAREQEAMAAEQARLLEEQKEMQAQMERDGAARAARQELQDDLQGRIAEAVAAATSGDFSARIEKEYGKEDLDRLANHFNDLMASVARGVDAVAAVTHEMARGDLTVRMEGSFDGAFARLQTSFNDALGEIARLVTEVLTSANSIDAEANSIAAASAELSQRTETQAATLEETAAAVTELTASIKSVAENSGEARKMACHAGTVAGESGEVVESAVSAMDRIVTSSSKISKVTALIDDIAFQTNLLALNAGVEAARAGESGRGFAVVATEVRALAHRSSGAAKEINALIAASEGEIGAGAEKISKAGESIREIAAYVDKLRDAIDTVATATSEQSISLDEVNAAMHQLDGVTQQNVAMFEETTASTEALRTRSAELVESGSRFRTTDKGGRARASQPSSMPALRRSAS